MFRSQCRKFDQSVREKPAKGLRPTTRHGSQGETWNRLATSIPSLPQGKQTVQTKLTVSAPDDRYEQQADRVADRVMRMPEPAGRGVELCRDGCGADLQRQPIEEEEEMLQAQPMEEEEEMLQAKREPTTTGKVSAPVSLQDLRGRGTPLPEHSRSYFEPRFGRNFSPVRIHTGPRAEEAATAVHARAFTSGHDIVFNKGKYAPESFEGRKLLAHELTHVIQQAAGADSSILQREDDEEEQQQFDYSIIPPSLRYRYGPFSVGADTSSARLGLSTTHGDYGLGYSYGSDIFATGRWGDLSTRLGVNPGSGALSFGGSYAGFNLGLTGSPSGSFGASIGYGAPLLPMPAVLGQQAGAAWQGALGVGGAIPDFVNDPLGTYNAQSENIGAISTFGSTLGRLYGQQQQGEGLPFGVGARLTYDPLARWAFYAGLQGQF